MFRLVLIRKVPFGVRLVLEKRTLGVRLVLIRKVPFGVRLVLITCSN